MWYDTCHKDYMEDRFVEEHELMNEWAEYSAREYEEFRRSIGLGED